MLAVLAAVLATGVFSLNAEDAKPESPKPEKAKAERRSDSPTREEWNKLTAEQKAEKIKEMQAKNEARIKELRDKKAAGTITETESKRLERMEAAASRKGQFPKRRKPAATTEKAAE